MGTPSEAMGRLISLAFRIPSVYSSDRIAQNVVDQLAGIGGSGAAGFGPQRVRSLADAVAKVLREHETSKAAHPRPQASPVPAQVASSADVADAPMGPVAIAAPASTAAPASVHLGSKVQTDLCPECGNASLRFIEGCQKCEICGFSKC